MTVYPSVILCRLSKCHLAYYLACFQERREERTWFLLFAHVLNRGGISQALWTIDLCLYTHDVILNTYNMVGALTHTSE